MSKVFLFIAIILLFETEAKFPSFFTKCYRKNPDFHECCKKAASAGLAYLTKAVPKYNLPKLFPLELPAFPLPLDPKGIVSADPNFTNCKIYGLGTLSFEKFEFDFEKKKFELFTNAKKWEQQCEYNMKGTILGIPIDGKGRSTLTLTDFKGHLKFNLEEYMIGQKKHLKLSNPILIKEPEKFSLTFEGQDDVNTAIKENSDKVYQNIRNSHETFIAQMILDSANAFYATLPLEEIFD